MVCVIFHQMFSRLNKHTVCRLVRDLTICCPVTNTSCYYHSFIPSSIKTWNSLPEPIVNITSLALLVTLVFSVLLVMYYYSYCVYLFVTMCINCSQKQDIDSHNTIPSNVCTYTQEECIHPKQTPLLGF